MGIFVVNACLGRDEELRRGWRRGIVPKIAHNVTLPRKCGVRIEGGLHFEFEFGLGWGRNRWSIVI